jgi:hypothetical protein
MKYKKIVGFGDSWIWGDELLDPALAHLPTAHPSLVENNFYRQQHCFLGQLGQYYQIPYENFGIPGGSLQSTLWTYLWWLEHEELAVEDCLILVGLTESSRTSFYNPTHTVYDNDAPWNRFVHSAWIHGGFSGNGTEWVHMVKANMVLTNCSELSKLNYNLTVKFFEGQYQCLSKNTLQFCTAPPPLVADAKNLVWSDRSLSFFCNKKELLAPGGHPNEIGHRLLRNHLIEQIESVILAEC